MLFNLLTDTDNCEYHMLQREAETAFLKTTYIKSIVSFLKWVTDL